MASSAPSATDRVFDDVNRFRAEKHLQPLKPHAALAEVAMAHARDMSEHDYRSHQGRDGRNPLERVNEAGIGEFHLLAENIGSSSEDGDRNHAIMSAWLDSPVHRENLLNPAFNTTGIAVIQTRRGETLVVQLFATF